MGKYRDEFRRVLEENGMGGAGSLHGWRCEHPDIYGPCNCLDGLLDDLGVVVDSIKAEVWDAGFTVGNAHNGRRDANPHIALSASHHTEET